MKKIILSSAALLFVSLSTIAQEPNQCSSTCEKKYTKKECCKEQCSGEKGEKCEHEKCTGATCEAKNKKCKPAKCKVIQTTSTH